jgi:hypothetical protein
MASLSWPALSLIGTHESIPDDAVALICGINRTTFDYQRHRLPVVRDSTPIDQDFEDAHGRIVLAVAVSADW